MINKPLNHLLRPSLLTLSISSALSVVAMGGIATTASAQDVEEVVVTGSRIVRQDFESNSPIVTVDTGDFESQTGLNIESYLNQLPTYNPAASPVTTAGDVQITPINSVGIASISLRGFGPNRSLVLVDGKRPTPINALMVTDINAIPSALIQRVETITGGASAVYGADAVGGVTNFILRDDFEGFEVDAQYGVSEAGDGDEYRVSAVIGTNFADGRGNVTLGVEMYDRKEALQAERDIYTDRWTANNTPGSFFFLQGVNGYSCNFDCHRHQL
jgi:outer membrane cobalamin receptor